MTTETTDTTDTGFQTFFAIWDNLNQDEMQERIDWLRENLIAGDDWGFCAENKTCVLKNESASIFYRMRWFEAGKQIQVNGDSI